MQHLAPSQLNQIKDLDENNNMNSAKTYNSTELSQSKLFKCKQCVFVCSNKEDYWKHQKDTHIKPEKLLSCTKCSFVTEYKHHLEYHLRNHIGSKPFKCSQCEYTCINLSMLRSHLKSHSKSVRYNCADCTYSTKYYNSLKTHMDKLNHLCSTNTPMQPENTANNNNKESLSSSLSSCSSSSSSSSSLSYTKKHKLNKSDSTKSKHHNKESISPNNFSKQASPSFDFNNNNNSSSNFAKNDTNNNYSNYNNNLAQRLNLLDSTSFNPVQFLADTNLLDFQKTVPFLNANFFLDQTLSSNNNNNNSPNQNNSINANNDTASLYLQSLKANLMPQPNDTKSLELQMALATAAALSSNFLPAAQANSDLDKANYFSQLPANFFNNFYLPQTQQFQQDSLLNSYLLPLLQANGNRNK